MGLRWKTLMIIGLSLAVLVVILFLVFRYTVFRNYEQLEKQMAADHVERFMAVVSTEVMSLDSLARDWAGKNEALAFIEGDDRNFAQGLLSDASILERRLNVVFLAGASGRIVFKAAYDLVGRRRGPFSPEYSEFFARMSQSDAEDRGGPSWAGIVLLPGDVPALVASSPVSGKAGETGDVGSLVVGRFLGRSEARRLAALSGFTLTVSRFNGDEAAWDSECVVGGRARNRQILVRPLDIDTVAGYTLLDPFPGGRRLLLAVHMPRDIYLQGLVNSFVLLASMVVMGFALAAATFLLLQRYVLSFLSQSITRLRSGVRSVARDGDPSGRIGRGPKGEFALLTDAINDMLETLEVEQKRTRQREQQLVHADKLAALGTLVSGVAHEISNPNNFIVLNAPMMIDVFRNILPVLDEYHDRHGDFKIGRRAYSELRSEIPELLSGICDGARRIDGIVTRLKDYARRDTDSFCEAVDVNEVAKAAVDLLDYEISKSTRRFREEYDKSIPLIKGNSQRLEQVIVNLLQNSCQALPDTEKGIALTTKYDAEAGDVVIEVRDEGVGISPDVMPRITDPFFTTKRDSKGTGLGLSVSAGIVSDHGGTLHFTSEPGKITVAKAVLPVGRAAGSPEGKDGSQHVSDGSRAFG